MHTWLGDAMALGCAMVWAVVVLAFRALRDVRAVALNLFKNTLASGLLVLTTLALGHRWEVHRRPADLAALAVSGVLGLAVADTLFLAGIARVDASVAAVADCIYSPTVIVLATAFLGEVPARGLLYGAPLVVVGVAAVAWSGAGAAAVDRRGLAYVLAGVVTTSVGVVIARPALSRADLFEATAIRLMAGAAALFLVSALRGRAREALELMRPQRLWKRVIPTAVLATYVSMLLWLGGMKYGSASRAALLTQTGTLWLLLASRLSGETVTRRRAAGAVVALVGVAIVLRM
jgi:drug/metabolite transporter (DMT)-like permease